MTAYTQAQQAVAELRIQLAERFTPELKRRVAVFFAISFAKVIVALILLALIGATYEPLAWTVLVLTGASYGWYAREELTMPDPIIYPFDAEEVD